jgi:regulatory protein
MRNRHDEPAPVGPAPNKASLRVSALRHLERFAATEAGLLRVLDRKITRWAQNMAQSGAEDYGAQIAEAHDAARSVVAAMVELKVVDDKAFAESRARKLLRSGHSKRAIGAHLLQKGVPTDLASSALPMSTEQELVAALRYMRKRGLGPYRRVESDPARLMREQASLARAGFPASIAMKALAIDREDAENLLYEESTE